jgi:hypothetical protein
MIKRTSDVLWVIVERWLFDPALLRGAREDSTYAKLLKAKKLVDLLG